MPLCAFNSCDREADGGLGDGLLCYFHSPDPKKPNQPLLTEIETMRQTKHADWRGWVVHLPVQFRDLNGAHFERTVFRRAVTFELSRRVVASVFTEAHFQDSASFDEVDFSDTVFDGARFDRDATFRRATFSTDSEFFASRFSKRADFHSTSARRLLRFTEVSFSGPAVFARASADSLIFVNTRFANVTNFYLTDMTHVSFLYSNVDTLELMAAVNLSKAEFHGIEWPASGLLPERDARRPSHGLLGESRRRDFESAAYRNAERVYRELRRGCEGRRQYADANWLDYREMEMRRLRHLTERPRPWGFFRANVLSTIAAYWLLSGYGHSLWKPVLWLLGVLAVSPLLFAWSGLTLQHVNYALAAGGTAPTSENYAALFLFGLRTAALVPEPADAALSSGAQALSVALRILGPLLGLLISLTVRRRLRR